MSFIKQARDAAKLCTHREKRKVLERCTDELHDAFGRFTVSCSKDDIVALVGAWTRVTWALDALPPLPEHGPAGGKVAVPKSEAA